MQNNSINTQGADEVDLIELVRGVLARKWLIIGVAFLVFISAAAFAFLGKPVYEVKLFIIPPT
ncbi:Wzz/FepE/Etk N-terminal domain-containing protein [Pseudomonas sp. St316]|uniref:Wzz/FepE/Etk N-terminal domain-containing protein n=1 Tax=Pseudomonas sp. St316 TaxID=2678257 RepID=UPI001BEFA2E0|nr:Wzz/FepE/Etk N-terminal domain-containing protein [Pseudomonas sp. St316]BBP60739.1 hypothetical protein PHLH4_43290 [Pseudomonas sp. St316]